MLFLISPRAELSKTQELPRDFVPQNQDGEVAKVRLVPLGEALRLARDTDELTVDAALVALDYFSRARVP